jgi:hypothetical protein
MRALSLCDLRHVKLAVIGHPKRNSTPKKTASTLRNVPKTATKCKLEGQSRTLSRRGGCERKMVSDQESGLFCREMLATLQALRRLFAG